jgi:hypothetical protein
MRMVDDDAVCQLAAQRLFKNLGMTRRSRAGAARVAGLTAPLHPRLCLAPRARGD